MILMAHLPAWAVPMTPVREDQILKTYTADVVVLGAGYSGTAAAKAAAEAGASFWWWNSSRRLGFRFLAPNTAPSIQNL